jgi:hypothetical protein
MKKNLTGHDETGFFFRYTQGYNFLKFEQRGKDGVQSPDWTPSNKPCAIVLNAVAPHLQVRFQMESNVSRTLLDSQKGLAYPIEI